MPPTNSRSIFRSLLTDEVSCRLSFRFFLSRLRTASPRRLILTHFPGTALIEQGLLDDPYLRYARCHGRTPRIALVVGEPCSNFAPCPSTASRKSFRDGAIPVLTTSRLSGKISACPPTRDGKRQFVAYLEIPVFDSVQLQGLPGGWRPNGKEADQTRGTVLPE